MLGAKQLSALAIKGAVEDQVLLLVCARRTAMDGGQEETSPFARLRHLRSMNHHLLRRCVFTREVWSWLLSPLGLLALLDDDDISLA